MAEAAPRRRRKRGWGFKLLIFLVLAGSIGGFSWLALKKEDPAETFAVLEVGRGNLIDKLADTGTIELVRTVEVKSTIAGEVRQLPIEAGDHVVVGQLLAIIEPDPNQSLQLYQKRSAVERGQLSVQEQERDMGRQKALFDSKMLPTSQYEDAQMRLTRARNDLRLAHLELEILETKANLNPHAGPGTGSFSAGPLQMDEIRVQAPISGIVIRRGVEMGEVVASGLSGLSGGTVMFEIGDPSQMIVRGDIAEIDIAKLELHQDVDIVVDAYPDTTYTGRVRWIAPVGLKQPGSPIVTFDTEIEVLDHDPRLRQGMSCDIDIIFSRRDSVVFLPIEAVIERFDGEGDSETQNKGRRGRFLAYVVRPDSSAIDGTGVDSTAVDTIAADTTQTDSMLVVAAASDTSALASAAAPDAIVSDSVVVADVSGDKKTQPEKVVLARFEEVTLEIGLETSTRIEVLSGLKPGDRVAADPELIARKLKELQTLAGAETNGDDE
ncbi:MAG: efflux RND transporter periplasmic adaptor subunit [bacterium]|nr:efflux RND transporter periplasmic adaptor subunit [bacterium]